ncbi:Cytochrome C oxidase subunit II transmembrane domain-containing protein [Dioscorea alata]|uniref:Cytochrome C oxidase subunit II transmembrane domain-containing protein n=1 Tax=Dioscorea alata TaxID=55571 RepID=A0ACB7W347_DIOAL|nr:Cytochrome C oxidase subunit II transmembrane domain-containing protein [Dioscorea alata]
MINHHHRLLFGASPLLIFLEDIQSLVHYFLYPSLHSYGVGSMLNPENGPLLVNYKSPMKEQMIDHHHWLLFVASPLSVFLEDIQSLVDYSLCLLIHSFGVGWVLNPENGPLVVRHKSPAYEQMINHYHCFQFVASPLSVFLKDIQSLLHYCLCLTIHDFGVGWVLNLKNGPVLVHYNSLTCEQMINHRHHCLLFVASPLSVFLEDIQSLLHYFLCLSIHVFGVGYVLNQENGPLLAHCNGLTCE